VIDSVGTRLYLDWRPSYGINDLRNFSVLIVADLKAFASRSLSVLAEFSCLVAGRVDRTIHVEHIAPRTVQTDADAVILKRVSAGEDQSQSIIFAWEDYFCSD